MDTYLGNIFKYCKISLAKGGGGGGGGGKGGGRGKSARGSASKSKPKATAVKRKPATTAKKVVSRKKNQAGARGRRR